MRASIWRSGEQPFGPPLIGALLRMPWEAVQEHMLARLHESGFGDFDAAYLPVFQYPGPQGTRPSELARLRITKQALNYLLGGLEGQGVSSAERIPPSLEAHRPHSARRCGGCDPEEAVEEVENATSRGGAFRRAHALLELNELT